MLALELCQLNGADLKLFLMWNPWDKRWLARPVRPRDLADETARRLLRLRGVVHRQIYSTSLHCRSHEHHARCFRLWTAPLGELCDLVQLCATKASYTVHDLDCHIVCLDIYTYEAIRACASVVTSSHASMIVQVRVFLHALIKIKIKKYVLIYCLMQPPDHDNLHHLRYLWLLWYLGRSPRCKPSLTGARDASELNRTEIQAELNKKWSREPIPVDFEWNLDYVE